VYLFNLPANFSCGHHVGPISRTRAHQKIAQFGGGAQNQSIGGWIGGAFSLVQRSALTYSDQTTPRQASTQWCGKKITAKHERKAVVLLLTQLGLE